MNADAPPELSVVIPAYNEAARLPKTLDRIRQALAGEVAEIIVVSDGSTDATDQRVQELAADWPRLRLISYPDNRGKGCAVRQGMLATRGKLVLFCDADGATPIEEWAKLRDALAEGQASVALGSRRAKGARIGQAQPWTRRFMGACLRMLTRLLLGLPYQDTQCGFKLFRGTTARRLFGESTRDGFDFDLEILLLARAHRDRVVEVGVTWNDDPESRVRAVRDSLRFLGSLLHYWSRFRVRSAPSRAPLPHVS